MLNPIESFSGLSLKVVAVRVANNSDFGFEFPAAVAPTTRASMTTRLKHPNPVGRSPLLQMDTWHHGGLNE